MSLDVRSESEAVAGQMKKVLKRNRKLYEEHLRLGQRYELLKKRLQQLNEKKPSRVEGWV